MNAQGEDDLVSDEDEHSDSDEEPQGPGGRHTPTDEEYRVGIARVPIVLLKATADALRGDKTENLQRAWMRAIAHNFPDTPLRQLRATDPSLLPPWIIEEFKSYKVNIHSRNHLVPLLV